MNSNTTKLVTLIVSVMCFVIAELWLKGTSSADQVRIIGSFLAGGVLVPSDGVTLKRKKKAPPLTSPE
jgi:hypothetical protein